MVYATDPYPKAIYTLKMVTIMVLAMVYGQGIAHVMGVSGNECVRSP